MSRVALIVLMSIAAASAGDKDNNRFSPGPASSYPGHQTMDQITIAAVPYIADEQAATAFGKVNPYKHDVMPVLVILQNDTGKALRLDLEVAFVDPDGKHIDATPASDVARLGAVSRAPKIPGENPLPLPRRQKKGPLNTWEIEGRAFSARMLPAGQSVHGFFYFQTVYKPGSRLYLNGIKDPASGKDYFYFEVPILRQ